MSDELHPPGFPEDPLTCELIATLRANPEATDRRIRDAVLHWWQRTADPQARLCVEAVSQLRRALAIPPSPIRDVQGELFDDDE